MPPFLWIVLCECLARKEMDSTGYLSMFCNLGYAAPPLTLMDLEFWIPIYVPDPLCLCVSGAETASEVIDSIIKRHSFAISLSIDNVNLARAWSTFIMSL